MEETNAFLKEYNKAKEKYEMFSTASKKLHFFC